MAYKYLNRAWMGTATAGTGTMTLGSAKAGFMTFGEAGLVTGDTVAYLIREGNDFEIGIGTYNSTGPTLTRDTVLVSKISGSVGTSKMVLAGAAEVFSGQPASEMIIQSVSLALLVGTIDVGHASDSTLSRSAAGVLAVEGINLLLAGKSDTISKGFTLSPANLGSFSSGTCTLDPTLGNYQYLTNAGAFTIAAPGTACAMDILVVNGASAGAITLSGFKTPGAGAGGNTYTTTSGQWWILSVRRMNGGNVHSWSGPYT